MRSKKLKAVDYPSLSLVRRGDKVHVPQHLIGQQKTMSAAIALCIQLSGLDDKQIYLDLDIDPGHWNRILKGAAHFPVNKLNDLMYLCGNEVPLMWLAHSRGYGLVVLVSESERRALDMEARALEAEKKLAWAEDLLAGRGR